MDYLSASPDILVGASPVPREEVIPGIGQVTVAAFAETSTSTGEIIDQGPKVRGATPDDLDALIHIELTAYKDVYGEQPSEADMQKVRNKYDERLTLLGDWVRVLESEQKGVFGMMVVCPTNFGSDDFLDRDMTANTFIQDAFDPAGENVYVVNLAILPSSENGNRFTLFTDMLDIAQERGLKKAFFESRLPSFKKWLYKQVGEGYLSLERETTIAYADEYWQSTEFINGADRPVDKLLRMYMEYGCKPLQLITEAWNEDVPSKAFGVLCEYANPNIEQTTDR